MSKKISIIGGDLRIAFLADLFAKDNLDVYMYGFEKGEGSIFEKIKKNEKIHICENELDCINTGDIIISSIPFSGDNETVKAPYSNKKIYIDDILRLAENKLLIAGSIKEDIYKKVEDRTKIIDIMKLEEVAILNGISTAEGTLKIAIDETKRTIHGSNILILGFGRLGKVLAKMFKSLNANVFCEARRKDDLAWIKAYGYSEIKMDNLDENLKNKQIIINTIPHMILDENRLNLIDKDCLIIDLASKPGGVDFKTAEKLGLKVNWALGIPRKSRTI